MLDDLLALLAPHTCLACGHEGTLWCASCSESAPPAAERCYRCHALSPGGRTCPTCRRVSALYSVKAATRYEATAKQLVWRLKFQRAQAAAVLASELMASRTPLSDHVLISHIPTSTVRVRRRGYDQALLIAKSLAGHADLPYCRLLLRLGKQEQHTATRRQRLLQLRDAFVVISPEKVKGRHIVLVDDVITTGATLEAAARALKTAGAKRVSAVVFAQA